MSATGVDTALSWSLQELPRALWYLSRDAGAAAGPGPAHARPPAGVDRDAWIERAGARAGLDVESVTASGGDVDRLLRGGGPAILAVPGRGGDRYLVLAGPARGRVRILATDGRCRRVPIARLRALLFAARGAEIRTEIEPLAAALALPPRRLARASRALTEERLADAAVVGWLVRADAISFRRSVRAARIPARVAGLLSLHLLQGAVWILSWWTIGKAALEGHFDSGWLWAWVLLLATLVPVRMLATWAAGRISVDLGRLLRERLLLGAIRLDSDSLRHQGVGHLLGRVLESDAIETVAFSGGAAALFSLTELVLTAFVLAAGAGGLLQVGLLVAWLAVTAALARRYVRRLGGWTAYRLRLTHDLIERMVGHRTRLVQEPHERWHDGEDAELADYAAGSVRLDRTADLLAGLVPPGWLVVGVLGLLPAFAAATTSAAALAVALGGVLLGFQALTRLVHGLSDLARAAVAWQQIAQIFAAGDRAGEAPVDVDLAAEPAADRDGCLVEARHLSYRYRERGRPVLRDVGLSVRRGERLLLEGPSGSGKSTLATILAGLEVPESGLLLLDGLDRRSLGLEGFRRKVVMVPQFHENHVFGTTFAFNLLMGRGWPPTAEDVAEALAVCRDLGLEELIARMPSGILQQVGETGWQLSHGERSRLFIARALLMRADLLILDESFAALDPETLHRTVGCVLDRAHGVLVIAHP